MNPPIVQSRRPARGFTLMEMLVSLAILAMISALLWQALGQTKRVERLLQRSGVDGQLDVVRREWLRAVIESSLVERTGAPRQLAGTGEEFTVAGADGLNLPGLPAGRLQLRFEASPVPGRRRLMVAEAPAADAFAQGLRTPAAPVELLSWEGRVGAVKFLDVSGQWLDQWPPPFAIRLATARGEDEQMRALAAEVPRLPRAVLLELGEEVGGPLIVSLSVTESGRMRREVWERQ